MLYIFQPLMPAVEMVPFVWLVVRAMVRGQWRSVIAESGALSVMTAGTGLMLQWSVNSWDSREQVSYDVGEARVDDIITLELLCSSEHIK